MMVLFLSADHGQAQTPPGDLTEMSLEQILGLRIKRSTEPGVVETTSSKWSISQRLIRISFAGNRDGVRELSDDEVLWARPPAPRTDKNYPIVPHAIHQEAYVTKIGYEMNDRWSWNFLTPYIVQETDHIANTARGAIPADFGNFIIRSEGVGDLTLSPSYLAWENEDMSLTLYNGLSMPVGAIDEKGDMPAPGDANQLPYTMQLGSGTFDYLPGVAFAGTYRQLGWSIQALGTVRQELDRKAAD
ncbi:MAG: hypothetical protein CMO80_11410 [Verrucomicrobiales bacterium]|nr:hypothetical protein [Verrucomicrobiales bacterium]|tara:strand:- start:530 stop:1264 length:735 start_codon:yes stop_codon:yes gene_type:complete